MLVAYGYGVISHRFGWFPTVQLESGLRQILSPLRPKPGFRNAVARTEVDCKQFEDPGSAIIVTFGQSNAANEGELGPQPAPGVFNFSFFDAKCYVALDPLLGATGKGGSVWSHLGNELVRAGRYRRVLIAPMAVGGSRVQAWAPGGLHSSRIVDMHRALEAAGLRATHILWHQGESDVPSTSEADYVASFVSMLEGMRRIGFDAPVYVAVASVCRNAGSEAIRRAQEGLPRLAAGVYPGPDTDELDRVRWRPDGCHFSAEGLQMHADLWLRALR